MNLNFTILKMIHIKFSSKFPAENHDKSHLANNSKSSLHENYKNNNQSTLTKSETHSAKALSFQNASQSAKTSCK